MAVRSPYESFPWREGVVPVEVDGELLVLDAGSGRVVRLSGVAKAAVEQHRSVRPTGLDRDTPGVIDALAGLGLLEERLAGADRRAVLRAGALAALGVSVLALPSAAAAATGGDGGGDGLFASGTGDETFTAAGAPNNGVYAVRTQPNGKIVIGGDFTTVGGVTRGRVARLNADGTLDTTFGNPALGGSVLAVDVDADFSVVAAGPAAMGGFARISSDGTIDAGFTLMNLHHGDANRAGDGEAVRIDPAGKIYVGGQFTHIEQTSRRGLARLHANGALDTDFADAGLNNWAFALDLAEGGVVVGGEFSSTSAGTYRKAVRCHANGAVDTSFADPNIGGPYRSIRSLRVDGAGGVTIAGAFTSLGGDSGLAKVARIHANGAADTSFVAPALAGSNADVIEAVRQSDGRVIIGGRFTSVGGTDRGFVARLEANGSLEPGFNPNANNQVWALDLDASGRVLVGGFFTEIGGLSRSNLARID
jgi:uncharacterized delta-60 repeat protein